MSSLLLRNVRPLGGDSIDIRIVDGRLVTIEADQTPDDGDTILECNDEILIPGLVDAHGHVDKTLWGVPWRPHTGGATVSELVANERHHRRSVPGTIFERSLALMRHCAGLGTTHLRTHVDVDPDIGLEGVHAILEARASIHKELSVEVVAFPQAGLLTAPGTCDLLEEALQLGANVVGGIDPAWFDGDPVQHLDTIFNLAGRHGCGLDIHIHEPGELGVWEIDQVIARTRALGLQGRVMISHAFALAQTTQATLERVCTDLAAAQIAIVTVAPGAAPIPPLDALRQAGVTICCGSDGIRDLWSPYGNGDMLERAMLLAYRAGFRRDRDLEFALEVATYGGASAMGLDGYGIKPGCNADLLLVPADTLAEAVVSRPKRTWVMKDGNIHTRAPAMIGAIA